MRCGDVSGAEDQTMYVRESLVGGGVVTATRGVRQESPTSSFFFIIIVNELIRLMKERCQSEHRNEQLHLLVLMDDTVLLSISRQNVVKKYYNNSVKTLER